MSTTDSTQSSWERLTAEQQQRHVAYLDEEAKGNLLQALKNGQKANRYRDALLSISRNTCCGSCQEAALVAKEALNVET